MAQSSSITVLQGQSNLDVCLQALGSFDGIVKFCNSNGIGFLSNPASVVLFSQSDIKNKLITNRKYATMINRIPLLNNDGTPLRNNNGDFLYNNSYNIYGFSF